MTADIDLFQLFQFRQHDLVILVDDAPAEILPFRISPDLQCLLCGIGIFTDKASLADSQSNEPDVPASKPLDPVYRGGPADGPFRLVNNDLIRLLLWQRGCAAAVVQTPIDQHSQRSGHDVSAPTPAFGDEFRSFPRVPAQVYFLNGQPAKLPE